MTTSMFKAQVHMVDGRGLSRAEQKRLGAVIARRVEELLAGEVEAMARGLLARRRRGERRPVDGVADVTDRLERRGKDERFARILGDAGADRICVVELDTAGLGRLLRRSRQRRDVVVDEASLPPVLRRLVST